VVIAWVSSGTNGSEYCVRYASSVAKSNAILVHAVIRGRPPSTLDLMRGIPEAIGTASPFIQGISAERTR
jgi:hypothetical protein